MNVPLEHFEKEEVECPCCGETPLVRALVLLQSLRYLCNFPLKISSGFRCEKHNKSAGGASFSKHTRGIAFDVSRLSPQNKYTLLRNALNLGFKGVGLYDRHIHIDLRRKPSVWIGSSK